MSIAIVAGALANKPLNGGVAWVPLSYALGLRRLGFDVYLVEELGDQGATGRAYFAHVSGDFGFDERSALLDGDRDDAGMRRVAAEAELLVNISGHARLEWLVKGPRTSAYVDTDPGFTQVWNRDGLLHPSIRDHTHHFSVGTNLGSMRCLVPDDGIQWRPSPPPVVLDEWPLAENRPRDMRFTTVATWRCPSGVLSLDGDTYLPSKLHEFRRVMGLPAMATDAIFEIALDIQPEDDADRENLVRSGWTLVDPHAVACDPRSFRGYVGGSAAEFSTVQGAYSALNTGWISDRSVRYLASGRPVLVQATGVSSDIADEQGLLTFTTPAEAERQVGRIAANYEEHAAAARSIAETHFDSDCILGEMLEQMGARP